MTQRRVAFALLAFATICVGLAIRFRATFLPIAVRDIMGDALWAFLVASLVSAVVPQWAMRYRARIALAVAYAVEFSQMLHAPWLDDLRATTPGHLVLGQGFDPRDLAAYLLGVAAFAIVGEAMVVRGSGRRW